MVWSNPVNTLFRFALPSLLLLALPTYSPAQTTKTIRFSQDATGMGKPQTVRIWLPKGYSRTRRYPAIFTFVGEDRLIADLARYYSEEMHQLPPVIVIGIDVEANDMGFSYETAKVNAKGARFARFLFQRLIPNVGQTYPMTRFRAFVGHSYGANYTDYLLREHASEFNAFALIAPEEPDYRLDYASVFKDRVGTIPYYVASGGLDLERRQKYAAWLEGAAGGKIPFFKHNIYPQADHLTIIPRAIPGALEFLFAGFKDFAHREEDGPLIPWFEKLEQRLQSLYGFGIERNSPNANWFFQMATERKDPAALAAFEKFFLTPQSDASLTFNAAQFHLQLEEFSQSEALYRRSIARAKITKQNDFSLMAYRTLALRIYSDREKDPAKAWKILEEGYRETRDVAFKFYFGMVAARHAYRLNEGIALLNEFETERSQSLFGTLYPLDAVYTLLARCYVQAGDLEKARMNVEKALKADPANEEAAELKKKLGG
ncbi:hypothetical protein EON81_07805 [bacterium]|nr:MAG: hypothetical protein EON81_07805 [bacterium]